MDINIEYNRPLSEEKAVSNAELTENYINSATQMFYKDGLDGQKRRIFGRIQHKLDDALTTKNYEVDFEAAELDFISNVAEKVNFPAHLSRYFVCLEDAIKVEIQKKNSESK